MNKLGELKSFLINEPHYVWAFLEYASRAIGGIATIVLVSIFFPLSAQGLLYALISLVAIRFLFESGFSQLLVTFVAYERNKLEYDGLAVTGSRADLARLKGICFFATKWCALLSALCLISFVSIGCFLFAPSSNGEVVALVFFAALLTSLEILLIPAFSILEGFGFVSQVFKFRFFKSLAFAVTFSVTVVLGAGVWSYIFALAASLIPTALLLMSRLLFYRQIFNLAQGAPLVFEWRKEVLPVQTRLAISAASGWFTFQIFTPMSYAMLGAETAARVGMTLAVCTAISQIASIPTLVNQKFFAEKVERREYRALDTLVKNLLSYTVFVHVVALFGLAVTWEVLISASSELLERVLDPFLFLFYFFGFMISLGTHPLTSYMRAHKMEPTMWLSVVTSISVVIGSYVGMYNFGVIAAPSVFLVTVLLSLPLTCWFYFRVRQNHYSS